MAKTYDPKNVVITVGGFPVEGYADGTFVSVARDADSYTDAAGADGEVARSRTNDNRGAVTFTLMQSSEANAELNRLNALDEVSNQGTFPVRVYDVASQSEYYSEDAWVLKPADASFGREIENREWTIRCADLRMRTLGIQNLG